MSGRVGGLEREEEGNEGEQRRQHTAVPCCMKLAQEGFAMGARGARVLKVGT